MVVVANAFVPHLFISRLNEFIEMAKSGNDSLKKAADKAAAELDAAAVAMSAGCAPAEALATKVAAGPEDAIGEYLELNGDRSSSPQFVALKLDDASPIMKFRVSCSGRVLIPMSRELIPNVGFAEEKPDLKSSDKETARQRNDLAKAGKHWTEMAKQATSIQSSLRYPRETMPNIAQTIAPGASWLSFIPSLITIGVIGFMRRELKRRS